MADTNLIARIILRLQDDASRGLDGEVNAVFQVAPHRAQARRRMFECHHNFFFVLWEVFPGFNVNRNAFEPVIFNFRFNLEISFRIRSLSHSLLFPVAPILCPQGLKTDFVLIHNVQTLHNLCAL